MSNELTKRDTSALALSPCSALLPCPFCGLTDRDSVAPDAYIPAVTSNSYPGGYRVECEGCGCNGPFHPQHAAALEAWNHRPNIKDQLAAGLAEPEQIT